VTLIVAFTGGGSFLTPVGSAALCLGFQVLAQVSGSTARRDGPSWCARWRTAEPTKHRPAGAVLERLAHEEQHEPPRAGSAVEPRAAAVGLVLALPAMAFGLLLRHCGACCEPWWTTRQQRALDAVRLQILEQWERGAPSVESRGRARRRATSAPESSRKPTLMLSHSSSASR